MSLGKEVTPVAKIMRCDCRHEVRGETDELVATMSIAGALVHGMVEITRK